VQNVTFQWNYITESLHCANHSKGCHGKGFLAGGGSLFLSFHHNLLAHHADRNPFIKGGDIDVVNNLIYNYVTRSIASGSDYVLRANYVGNYFFPGPTTKTGTYGDKSNYAIQLINDLSGGSGVYVKGNIHPTIRPEDTGAYPEDAVIRFKTSGSGACGDTNPPCVQVVTTRYNHPTVTTTDAFTAKTEVLDEAGAVFPVRDAIDTRVRNDVINETAPQLFAGDGKLRMVNDPSEVGGWPTLSSGTPPLDTDHDGMPDAWESAHGLNTTDSSDSRGTDLSPEGYTQK
jgi:hypothetical protein